MVKGRRSLSLMSFEINMISMPNSEKIIIFNNNATYKGLMIELKNPNGRGVVSSRQNAFIRRMRSIGWYCMVSNDYDIIIEEIIKYMYSELSSFEQLKNIGRQNFINL